MRRHRHLVASSPLVADALRAAAPPAEVVLAPLSLDPDALLARRRWTGRRRPG